MDDDSSPPLIDPVALADAQALLEDAFRDVVDFYRTDSPALLAKMRALQAAGERTEWGRLAHTLKSSSRQLGLLRVGYYAAQLEALATQPASAHDDSVLQALQAALQETLSLLSGPDLR